MTLNWPSKFGYSLRIVLKQWGHYDLRHVLDKDRTGLHAGQAGCASPEDVVGDDLADHHLLALGPAISPFR